jgi:hypothetical protein
MGQLISECYQYLNNKASNDGMSDEYEEIQTSCECLIKVKSYNFLGGGEAKETMINFRLCHVLERV